MTDDTTLRMSMDIDAQIRRQMAVQASDIQALRDGLLSAASRFADLADIIEEKKGDYDPVPFMRESAKRYRILAGIDSPTLPE